ncbi:Down syndrome cell adhesion molecule-like protein Dscam2 isoform X6 [Bombus vosnesenskii]|uniref:Down syndrome cell adhesion molecule-like protein Dscam2 isoform X6 n=2 Tax=Pyrobombus TaxID=144703 RepID=A0A6J3KWT5_9HYME|nr:Down syndrome cell adhesion molecule-like protein Dscam2 isoform X6 [Bombus bifarius]XP_033356314.1 Down syndrome cell adhesion molecule-like protein Dscam2 isoform X6 [Bombus vosnesenskii]
MASWPLRIVLLSSTLILVRGRGVVLDSQGPVLISEPRSSVEFSNETGAMIHCSAQGSPLPRIDWLMGDESPVLPIPHIREMLVNGSMYFLPFSAETYRHDVHAAVYRCQASNSVGRVLGREITVKAVVRQKYEVQVRDVYVLPGNTGVLRCDIPTFVKEYVAVTSWVRDSAYNIFPTPKSDPHTPVPPRFNERMSPAPIRTGETIVLSCVSQGIPPPMYLWFRESVTGTAMIFNSERIYARAGALVLQSARAEDAGRYVCHANNTAGSEMVELEVSIISSLSIHLVPQQVTVDLGKDAEFQCSVTGQPIPVIFWTKDGLPVGESASGRSKITGKDGSTLRVSSVVRDDKGMYQCFAKNDYEMVQATAELRLGDAAPQLLYKFIEQTIQPGPSVSLKCIATGNPTPHFSWTLDGFPLPQNDRFMIGQYVTVHGDVISHVNISVVHVEDGGEYRCTAANRMAKVHHSARLNIYGLPHVRPMGNYGAVAGETTVIKCPVAGFPIASITWEKDGKVLPTSRRQEVFPNGTLVLHHVDRSTDHGAYTCTAKNKQGRSDSQTVHIEVKVPPTIAPFSFNKDLSEGVRAQVTCMVEKGDPPFTIAWSKDGEPIAGPSPAGFGNTGITGPRHTQTPAGLRVTNIDAHSSTIVIERVNAAHSGNYTCLARNSVAEVLWTAELIVRVPPRWVMEPQDVRASEGMSRLVLHCHADGFPPPAVSWRRASGKKPGNYRDIVTHEHPQNLRIHSNGSLVFGRVQEDHEGFYLCEAVNGIGAGLSKVVHLTVNVPAHFVEKHRNQTARLGSSASLRCEAKGDHPLKIIWKKMGAHLEQKLSDYRYTLKEENTTDGSVSTLEFISTSREDSARYFCIASNAYGRDEMTIHLYIQEPPDFPRNLHVIEKGSRYINISWTTSQDGNSPITQYIIEYKTDTAHAIYFPEVWHDHTFHMTVPGTQVHAHVNGLRPAVSYQFRIYAENELGRSQASDILETTTEGEKPGGPPRNLKVDPVSSTEFNVTWDPPDHDLWNGEILGYHVGYKEHRLGADQYTFRTVERRISTASVALGLARTSMPGRQYQLTNLKKFARYSVVVQAYNVLGQGPMTPDVVATTLEDVPSSPPQDIRCTPLSSQSLQVSWDAPPDSSLNGILKGYKVIWENMNALTESPKTETKITTALTVVIHSLEKYTNYSVQVLASTRAGDGIASSPLHCVTEEDLPEVPAGVKAVVRSATSIIVSWQPPLRSNGNITSYNVHIRWVGPEGKWYKRALPPYQTSYQVENLHKKNQYEFSIAAVTSVGEGPQTQPITVSLSNEVRAAVFSFGTVLVVPWKQNVTLPCQSVGNPEPSVTWKQWGQIVKSSSRVSLLTEGSLQIMDLHREDSGNYTCYVKNRHGSDQITHRLTVQVPPAAPLLHATSATSNSINVQWKNRDDGGASIRGYILHYKRESGEWEEVKVSHKINSFVLSRLWCGNDYQMYLTAYNRIGMGSPSEIVKATTNGSKPESSPSNGDKFITVNVSWITLHLSMWNDGGCPITYFELEYRKNGDDIWTLVSNSIEVQKTYTLSELQPGSTYDIRIRAHNNAGFSVAEYRITTLQPHTSSTVPSVEIDHYIPQHTSVYSDLKLIVPLILSSLAIIAAAGAVFYCFRKRPFIGEIASLHDAQTAAALDNKQNMEQREQYYATVRKPLRSPIHEMATLEKIPEYSEDIYPYATFQLEESVPPGGDSRCNSAAPLQTFVYHDPRLSTADTLQLRESDCNRYTKVRGGRSSSAPLHKTHKVSQGKSESEEYDTLGSDSDTEVGTSSRTESSNHLVDSHHSVSAADSRVHNFLYHGPESSTSTEPSPIFERKSFPGRGRSKMLQLARHTSEETRSNFGPISGFGNSKHQSSNSCSNRDQERDGSGNLFVPKLDPPTGFSDAFELSEAECDFDRGHSSQRNVRDFVIAV